MDNHSQSQSAVSNRTHQTVVEFKKKYFGPEDLGGTTRHGSFYFGEHDAATPNDEDAVRAALTRIYSKIMVDWTEDQRNYFEAYVQLLFSLIQRFVTPKKNPKGGGDEWQLNMGNINRTANQQEVHLILNMLRLKDIDFFCTCCKFLLGNKDCSKHFLTVH